VGDVEGARDVPALELLRGADVDHGGAQGAELLGGGPVDEAGRWQNAPGRDGQRDEGGDGGGEQ
jgi:hypothetical protein